LISYEKASFCFLGVLGVLGGESSIAGGLPHALAAGEREFHPEINPGQNPTIILHFFGVTSRSVDSPVQLQSRGCPGSSSPRP
jgi:hypothetical protein